MAPHKTKTNSKPPIRTTPGGRRTAAALSWTFPSALPGLDYPSSLSHSFSSQSDGDVEDPYFLGVETGHDEQPMGDRQLAVDNSDLDDFYLRYYVGHRTGRHGHEFTEFEIYASGKLRYANHSKYKNEPLIRREVQLNAAVVDEFKRIIIESAITDVDDQKWPEPAGEHSGRQELECKVGRHHICLLYTSPSPRDRTRSRMPSSA